MPLLKVQKLVFKTNYRSMQVKSIAECSKGSILQYFRPSLSYHLSLRYLFCVFLSGRFTQILLFTHENIHSSTLAYRRVNFRQNFSYLLKMFFKLFQVVRMYIIQGCFYVKMTEIQQQLRWTVAILDTENLLLTLGLH